MKKNGFTLIELLAVIVILAIIALIVTPIVSGIITSARNSANARSVEGHIRNVELAIVTDAFATGAGDLAIYDRTNGTLPSGLTIPTNDNITCETYTINNGQVVEATKCADYGNTANWHKTYKYTATNGAEPDGELGSSSNQEQNNNQEQANNEPQEVWDNYYYVEYKDDVEPGEDYIVLTNSENLDSWTKLLDGIYLPIYSRTSTESKEVCMLYGNDGSNEFCVKAGDYAYDTEKAEYGSYIQSKITECQGITGCSFSNETNFGEGVTFTLPYYDPNNSENSSADIYIYSSGNVSTSLFTAYGVGLGVWNDEVQISG